MSAVAIKDGKILRSAMSVLCRAARETFDAPGLPLLQ